MGAFVQKLLGLVTGNVGAEAVDFFKQRQALKNQLELAQLESQVKAEQAWAEWRVKNIDADEAWEEASIKNSGWKDEYVLIILSIPLVMVFIPPLAPYVLTGFSVLMSCPDWYRWLVVMIFAAVYGIRVWRRPLDGVSKPAPIAAPKDA